MNHGEFLTRASIWLALLAYALAAGWLLTSPHRHGGRLLWTLGCLFFLLHVFSAFTFFHHWSHTEAARETARQTAALTGWRWSGGIYINYLFAAAWVGDVLWWWLAPQSFARRSAWLSGIWHGFFFFLVFNGTIVFGHGPVRVLGAAICLTLAALWFRRQRQRPVS